MKRVFYLVLMLSAAAPVLAANLLIWPPEPTTQDALVLDVRSAPPCAAVLHGAIELRESGVIRIPFDDGSRVLCTRPDPCPLRIPLGRLPAGEYTVEFVPDRPSLTNASALSLIVYKALAPDAPDAPDAYNFRRGWRSQYVRSLPLECRDIPNLESR
jgi:hypothetical protein